MELKNTVKKFSDMLKKYRYVALIVLIGVILMAFPTKSDATKSQTLTQENANQKIDLEQRLSSILSLVDGAGEVHVILSVAAGEETIYQMNGDYNSSDSTTTNRQDTVTVSSSDRSENGLIKQVLPQIYQGAVVVCTGGDDPAVRLSIVDAVSKLTGLGANQISVMKMK